MLMKRFFLYILLILTILKIQVLTVGCANIIPPEGGYKDSVPPLLVKASPADSSKNFQNNRITLTFNEFVDLQNIHENLIISPIPNHEPDVNSKFRTITIKLKDTLEPNTTYSINFGNAIKDINEGNVSKNFTYIFSTGSSFDSLSLAGKVTLAENGKTDTTLIVMLHKNGDDSAIVKENPRYITRLDRNGNFTFRNLPPGTFYVYALKEEGGGHRYLSGKQLFAFADKPVTLQAVNEPVNLYAYTEKETTPLPQINLRPRGPGNSAERRLRLTTNTVSGSLDLLSDFIINFDQPLKKLDSSLIHFSRDSAFIPVSGYRTFTDSTNKKLSLQYTWKENTLYHVIVEKDFAEDSSGRKLLKTDTLSFKTKKLSEYGSLRIRFKNFDPSVNPVLLFVQNDVIAKSLPLNSAEIKLPVFLPGEYELRILNDRNKNGKWDTGEFFGKHIQPEIVIPIVSRPRITVKANWENEFDIEAPSNSPKGGG